MPRTPLTAASLLLALAACAPRAPLAPVPVPAPPPPEAPADPEVELGAGFALSEAPRGTSGDLLGSASYDLPVAANEWVRMELEFLVHQRHAVVGRWLERSARWEGWIEEVLGAYGVPRDLVHLAMIESGFQPTVRSRAGAVGLWQFMPSTGRGMGLRVDSLVDERMDPVRSTHAAARHLRDLHRRFGGDWALAAAAYNAGEGRISRGLARFGARDFWELAQVGDLAQETRHYVPRLYAMTIIGRERARFGFPAAAPRAFRVDSVRVDLAVPLPVLAEMGAVAADELRELNPHLLRQTAPRDYWVWVPHGAGETLGLAWLQSDYRRRGGYGDYRVREGDSLEEVARLANLTVAELRALNAPASLERLRPGERIRVYADADAARALAARPSAPSAAAPRSAARAASPPRPAAVPAVEARTHTVGEGESLWSIARRHAVGVDALREANALQGETIRPGQILRIPGARVAAVAPSSASAGPRHHTVAEGETLWGIARRYDTRVEALRRANELGEGDTLRPGQRLTIPR